MTYFASLGYVPFGRDAVGTIWLAGGSGTGHSTPGRFGRRARMAVDPDGAGYGHYRLGWSGAAAEISFVDVGQGDSTLVRFPGGASLLVDAGGGAISSIWVPASFPPTLWASGVRQLATLAITAR